MREMTRNKLKLAWSKFKDNSNAIIVLLTFFFLVVTIFYNNSLINLANESAQQAQKSLDQVRKLVEWTKPEPNITIWSNANQWGEDGVVYVQIEPLYSPKNGVNDGIFLKPVSLEFLIFNAGKAPVASAFLNVALQSDDAKDVFPFKIYEISTPLHRLYYNRTSLEMMESFETDFPFPRTSSIPYWHINEKNVEGFPPSFIDGKVAYGDIIKPYEFYQKRNYSQYLGAYKIGSIGPFVIGNIEPSETRYVEIKIFGAVENYTQILDNDPSYWTQQKLFASGSIIITVESANCGMVKYSLRLESYFNTP